MNRNLIILILNCLSIQLVFSQQDTIFLNRSLTFPDYMELVKKHNIEFAAEKFNVSIAEAAIEIAKIVPDPYVNFDWTENREARTRTGYEYSSVLGTTIELGRKRKARIDLARSEKELSKALLADFFRSLQAAAALTWLDAMKQKQVYKVGYNSFKTMKHLADADSIRFKLGTIMQIDAIQSKLEAGILYNDVIHSFTEWTNSLVQIALMTGKTDMDTLLVPANDMEDTCRIFLLDELTATAINNRSDLLAALKEVEVSQNALHLARKERIADIDLHVGASNSVLTDGISPSAKGITGGIGIPLKFSNFSRGTIKMAQANIAQSEVIYKLVEMRIISEIRQAWNLYYVHCRQVDNFEEGLLKQASDVIKGKIYSYQRGETSLLEVLNARRTFDDIQLAYYGALYDRAAALINLEKSAGIWDIDL